MWNRARRFRNGKLHIDMAVRCSKCGEVLLGAVNRCWKCGQMFAQRPEIDGRPPVRVAPTANEMALQAEVVDSPPVHNPHVGASAAGGLPVGENPFAPQANVAARPASMAVAPVFVIQRPATTAAAVDARRHGIMAMGGTVTSLALGLFAVFLSLLWAPAAIIAVLGLIMGVWGLYSPRRNLALIGMLLCCLAIGIGAYGGAQWLVIRIKSQQPTVVPYSPE
jgi:hypothetical protein